MDRPAGALLAALTGSNADSWAERAATAAIFVAGAAAGWAAVRARADTDADAADANSDRRRASVATRRTWATIAVVLVVLAISKQFGVHSWLLEQLRQRSRDQGWYQRRREYQADFIVASLVVGAAAMAVVARLLRRVDRTVVVAAVACGCLVLFVLVRAVSFHGIDGFVARHLGGHLDEIVQFACTAVIALGAVRWGRRSDEISSRPRATPGSTPSSSDRVPL